MHIKCFRVENFRRLKKALVHLENDRTIFVGANNSGKTSATHLFQIFLGNQSRAPVQIYDFTADCWDQFTGVDDDASPLETELPRMVFDLWFHVDDDNLHRVVDLLPSLDWDGEPVGVRIAYAVRDVAQLLANYRESRSVAEAEVGHGQGSYRPWPRDLFDYLTRRLSQEYEFRYYLLDARQCSEDLEPYPAYQPFFLGTAASGAAKLIDAIVRVDFLDAQRHLSDADSRGRGEDLSKRLSRFYERNLDKLGGDIDALSAIADSEDRLNAHFAKVFAPILSRLGEVGYPGTANPGLMVKAEFNARGILSSSAKIHYSLSAESGEVSGRANSLPDQYNGLGFKNLIYMVVEILDFHRAWLDAAADRPPIHLIVIEEPEVHLHAQLQQVFIGKVLQLVPNEQAGFHTQLVATTHSPHIIYESDFTPIRYFCRAPSPAGVHLTDVKNLSTYYLAEDQGTRAFLQQYIKLTHCDLFFADAVVLVEGNVERLLLPAVIARVVPGLKSCHLTILEVGGAFAHRFEKLMTFLGVPTLVITDLDSVHAKSDAGEESDADDMTGSSCPVNTDGALTSNPTLTQWLPRLTTIDELLAADNELKASVSADGTPGLVRVAYQTREQVVWRGETGLRAGRTLEEAFALQNLDWTQSVDGQPLGLKIAKANELSIGELHNKLFDRVKSFDKTAFALGVIAAVDQPWHVPAYIVDGLCWLHAKLTVVAPENVSDDVTSDPVPQPEALRVTGVADAESSVEVDDVSAAGAGGEQRPLAW